MRDLVPNDVSHPFAQVGLVASEPLERLLKDDDAVRERHVVSGVTPGQRHAPVHTQQLAARRHAGAGQIVWARGIFDGKFDVADALAELLGKAFDRGGHHVAEHAVLDFIHSTQPPDYSVTRSLRRHRYQVAALRKGRQGFAISAIWSGFGRASRL